MSSVRRYCEARSYASSGALPGGHRTGSTALSPCGSPASFTSRRYSTRPSSAPRDQRARSSRTQTQLTRKVLDELEVLLCQCPPRPAQSLRVGCRFRLGCEVRPGLRTSESDGLIVIPHRRVDSALT